MKHTPGPWEVHHHSHCNGEFWASIGYHGRGPIADIVGKEGCHTCTNNGYYQPVAELKYLVTPVEEQKANARLIASAPETHEAAKQLLPVLRSWWGMLKPSGYRDEAKRWIDRLADSIAKAEGR